MIDVQNLTQSYGKKTILNQATLSVKENEVCALVGRNGAGKSTFINSLLGLLPVKTGTIKINGKERSKKQHWRNEIAYLPEKFMLYPSLTGYENMLFFAKTSKKQLDETKMKEILTSVRLWDDKDAPIKGYSKGMLQRLGLGITLYQDSDIIILDEPTSGIDPIGRNEILEILKGLTNKTILLSSHHLDEIKQLCTHVAYLDEGKITKYPVEEFVQLQHLGGR
ncbi:ABC transporter ATP-binding protein [Mesobacillus maritimus]|uniref:ABC transporter ATP-binding protein n=1 Tax=Mesobacillus maritimus TaxID=1643336 RepID=A0ABS7K5E0_9BACI|nr:ABC transporter ATP-binding protein [Mesobacillus maritimus]MBY0097488.1 ABC transporter ATP-binding protein [Mesobacillus maritimus]